MRAARFLCGLLCILLLGCDPEPQTAEQAVYESFFEALAENRTSFLYLAKATENAWFNDNPFEKSEWNDQLDDLGGISMDLVEELYRVNRDSGPINWNPTSAIMQLLPAEYAQAADTSTRSEHCLVSEDQPHIGVHAGDDGYFRPYYTVSRVAFSQDGTYALLKFSRRCAPMTGAGEFFASFMLERGHWKIVGGRMLWVS